MSQPQEKNILGTEPIGKLLVRYAVPSIVSMVVMAIYNIVDQIFIAQGVGYIGNGATTVAFPLVTISMSLALMVGNGTSAFISLELGKGNADRARESLGNALLLLAGGGLLLLAATLIFMEPILRMLGATDAILPHAVDYVTYIAMGFPFVIVGTGMTCIIRADGSPRYSMMASLVGAGLNTVLDPIFIFTLQMGVKGAAIATSVSQAVSFSIAFYYILRKGRFVRLRPAELRPDLSIARRIMALGSSSFITQFSMTIVNVVLNNSLAHYGALSVYGAEIPISALGIVMKINSIFINVVLGVAIGAQPILGYNYGACNYARVKQTYKTELRVTVTISALANLLFVLKPEIPLALFRDENPVFNEFAADAVRALLLLVVCVGIQIPSANYFQAVGKPLRSMILTLCRQFLFLVPCILILPLFFGLWGIIYAYPITDILALCVTLFFITRELRHLNNPPGASPALPKEQEAAAD